MWVRIPLETYIFILNFSLPPRSEQVNGAVANEIKHVHSPEVIVVLDSRYDLSYKALYISTCSIALMCLSTTESNATVQFSTQMVKVECLERRLLELSLIFCNLKTGNVVLIGSDFT